MLEGVMGVTDVTSDSIPGLSQIDLHFAPGTSLYQARQLVQERLTQAFVLPNVSKPPVLLQPVSSTGNVMLVGLTSRRLSLIDLSVLARWTIVPRLLGVAGVAEVAAFGEADRQLQVLIDPPGWPHATSRWPDHRDGGERPAGLTPELPAGFHAGHRWDPGGPEPARHDPARAAVRHARQPGPGPGGRDHRDAAGSARQRHRHRGRSPAADRRRPGARPARAGARGAEAAVGERALR